MTQAERAVERGRGPSKLKDSFYVEDISRIDTTDREFPTQIKWATGLSHRIDMVIICCWWLLRGIEAASVMLNQAWTENTHSGRTAFITLPCTKMDIVGLCVTRSHPCSCHRSKALCPFHALQRHLARMKSLGYPDDSPLFPGNESQPLQHYQTVEIFRSVIEATGTTMTRNGPNGSALQRFCEHVCRVSGAQMLTRRGFPLDTVSTQYNFWAAGGATRSRSMYRRHPCSAETLIIEVRKTTNPNRFERSSSTISRPCGRNSGWSIQRRR